MFRFRVVLAAASMVLTGALHAAEHLLDGVAALPELVDARLQEAATQPDMEKLYPLGSVSRISGQLRFGDELRVRGERQAHSWQLSPVHSATAAFTAAREWLQRGDARLLYWCEGRDCGPSNLWANAVFGNARLYGPDERQQYALLAANQQLVALYAVTRGNGRGMLHAETFATSSLPAEMSPGAATLLLQLRTDGQLELTNAQGSEHVNATQLARALNRDMTLRVALGGPQAQDWRERLIDSGVRAARIELTETAAATTHIEVLR